MNLLNLPPEILTQIIHFALPNHDQTTIQLCPCLSETLPDPQVKCCCYNHDTSRYSPPDLPLILDILHPSLLRTCHQLRIESLAILKTTPTEACLSESGPTTTGIKCSLPKRTLVICDTECLRALFTPPAASTSVSFATSMPKSTSSQIATSLSAAKLPQAWWTNPAEIGNSTTTNESHEERTLSFPGPIPSVQVPLIPSTTHLRALNYIHLTYNLQATNNSRGIHEVWKELHYALRDADRQHQNALQVTNATMLEPVEDVKTDAKVETQTTGAYGQARGQAISDSPIETKPQTKTGVTNRRAFSASSNADIPRLDYERADIEKQRYKAVIRVGRPNRMGQVRTGAVLEGGGYRMWMT